jgi:hypothetical protein
MTMRWSEGVDVRESITLTGIRGRKGGEEKRGLLICDA